MADRVVVDGFSIFGGKHCETSALRKVFGYRGLEVSEEMLLGLGGGIGFIYWYMKMMAAPFIGTRSGGKEHAFVRNICRRLGIGVEIVETGSARKGYMNLKAVLDQGEPAVVYGDMVYLPYFAIPEVAHFGGHAFVVYGIDEDADEVLISDCAKTPLSVSTSDLAKARGSKHIPYPPKHRVLRMSHPKRSIIRKSAIYEAIRECCEKMLTPPIKNIGIPGMKKWSGLVLKWPEQFSGFSLYGCLMNTYMFIEISGTGGSAFRPMYARFLDEAADLTGVAGLAEAADMFRTSGVKWSAIANTAMPESNALLARVRELIAEKSRIFEEQGQQALGEMRRIQSELNEIQQQVECGLGPVNDILSSLQKEMLACVDAEAKAFRFLSTIVG